MKVTLIQVLMLHLLGKEQYFNQVIGVTLLYSSFNHYRVQLHQVRNQEMLVSLFFQELYYVQDLFLMHVLLLYRHLHRVRPQYLIMFLCTFMQQLRVMQITFLQHLYHVVL